MLDADDLEFEAVLDDEESAEMLGEELFANDDGELEGRLIAVDRLICPLAAHGGGIFAWAEIE